jgi:hypothetical protein
MATLATPLAPQKAFVIIVGHDITTTPTVPPGLQPLLPYKQPPKETDRKEQNNIVGVIVRVVRCCAIGLYLSTFGNIILSNVCGATSLGVLKKIIRKNL